MRTALPYQATGIDQLSKLKIGALFPEPGTGKTFMAYQLIESVQQIDGIIWVGPFQTIHHPMYELTIKAEIDKCGKFTKPVHYYGIETIQASDRQFMELYELMQSGNYFLVIDESAKIKNGLAKRTKRMLELSQLAEYKLILNGVPISRNLLDIHSQMNFLSLKILNMDATEFEKTYCESITIKKRFGGNRFYEKKFIVKYHNIDHLYSLIQPYIFACDLQLEKGQYWLDYSFNLNDEEESEYNRIKEKYLDDEKLMMMNNSIFLELTQKLQHMYSCSEEKFQLLKTYLEENGLEKVVVFRKYILPGDEIKKRFPGLAVFSLQKESLGLNLQAYNHIIIWDKTWDYLLIKQLIHRIFRTGQEHDCYFVNFNGNVGLENLILKNNEKKGGMLKYFKMKGYQILKDML